MAEYLKFRRLMSLALVMSGAVLLAYGLFVHAAIISSAEDANTAALANRETVLIREVAIGGLERDSSGQLKKTYTGQPPSACPT